MEIIRIEDLCKIYKTKSGEVNALTNINLTINEKDVYGIIGLSGAGKSTLIRCMNFLEKPTSGKVYYKGIDLESLSGKELRQIRQNIGMIFQNFNLLAQKNVLKNVLFPLEIAKVKKDDAKLRASELLEIVGLKDKALAYPSELSGGERQRVAIARALACNPSVLLCDEATSALDPANTDSILSLLKEINHKFGITIVIITHEMRVIEAICNKVAIISNSSIAEKGDVSEIFINPKTDIAKELIMPKFNQFINNKDKKYLRIVFDGTEEEPIIAEMVLHTKTLVSILQADIKTVNGKTFGELIIEVSNGGDSLEKVTNYLTNMKVLYKEVLYDN